MKQKHSFLLYIAILSTLFACQNGDEIVEPKASLSLSVDSLSFTAYSALAQTVTVSANGQWIATTDAEWLTIAEGSGTGDGSFVVKPSDNTSTVDRTATITVKSGTAIAKVNITQKHGTQGTENGHEWVGLGLSVCWATKNVGANQPYDYGLYFAWGETTGHARDASDGHSFNWTNYKWCNGSETTLTKYCTDSIYGTVDNKTVLELADDAARVNWGGNWRMPTWAELKELRDHCTWTWMARGNETYNGVEGCKVTGTNGNSIFLPTGGSYWTASLNEGLPIRPYNMGFDSGGEVMYAGGALPRAPRAGRPSEIGTHLSSHAAKGIKSAPPCRLCCRA